MQYVLGQEHVVNYLRSQIKKPPHLLLTGPSGCGKTLLARGFIKEHLLAHNIPLNAHADQILLLQSADDRGMNSLRSRLYEFIRKKHAFPEAYAWVWIDDADGLPPLTQQALRRMMEKYEGRVRFLFCSCTSAQFIEAIQSRVVIMQLLPMALAIHAEELLQRVAPTLKLSDDAYNWLVVYSSANARQFIQMAKLLDNLPRDQKSGLHQQVQLEEVQAVLGIPPITPLQELSHGIVKKDALLCFHALTKLYSMGYAFEDILYQMTQINQVYDFLSPADNIKISEICAEGQIRIILRTTSFLDLLALFSQDTQYEW